MTLGSTLLITLRNKKQHDGNLTRENIYFFMVEDWKDKIQELAREFKIELSDEPFKSIRVQTTGHKRQYFMRRGHVETIQIDIPITETEENALHFTLRLGALLSHLTAETFDNPEDWVISYCGKGDRHLGMSDWSWAGTKK